MTTEDNTVHSNPITTLIAHTDQNARQLLATALTKTELPINMRFISDGQQLIDYFKRMETEDDGMHLIPDIILIDLSMPFLAGKPILKVFKLNPQHKNISIFGLVASNQEQQAHQDHYNNNEIDGYLYSTLPMEELTENLATICNYAVQINARASRKK